MKRIEYRQDEYGEPSLMRHLKEMGAAGWEVVRIEREPHPRWQWLPWAAEHTPVVVVLYKREMEAGDGA